MIKLAIGVVGILMIWRPGFAPAAEILVDGDVDRIGTAVSVPDPDTDTIHLTTDDGYLIKFDAGSGHLRMRLYDGVPGRVWYESTDCTGQGYTDYNDGTSEWLYPRGGEIFQMGLNPMSNHFARVEWAAPSGSLTLKSSHVPQDGQGCKPENANRELVPITFINPSDYGIKHVSEGLGGYYGFKTPIRIQK